MQLFDIFVVERDITVYTYNMHQSPTDQINDTYYINGYKCDVIGNRDPTQQTKELHAQTKVSPAPSIVNDNSKPSSSRVPKNIVRMPTSIGVGTFERAANKMVVIQKPIKRAIDKVNQMLKGRNGREIQILKGLHTGVKYILKGCQQGYTGR